MFEIGQLHTGLKLAAKVGRVGLSDCVGEANVSPVTVNPSTNIVTFSLYYFHMLIFPFHLF